jgi:parvulin-like peptidyl-prolyl isomerase
MGKAASRKQRTASPAAQRKGAKSPAVVQTKKQIARSKKEARQTRIIWLSIALLAVVLVGVVAAGLVTENIVKPASPVAIVNGNKLRTDEFQDLLQYRRYNLHANETSIQDALNSIDTTQQGSDFLTSYYQQQLTQIQSALTTAPDDALTQMIDDELIREKAQELGIVVTDDDVTNAINSDLQQIATQSQTSTTITDTQQATPVPQSDLDKIYQKALDAMGLSDAAFRSIIKQNLISQQVQDQLASQVVTTGLVIHVQLIQTDTQEQADAAKARIDAGEDFAIVAKDVSTDTTTADNGGDLGWVTVGQLSSRYGEPVEAKAFSLDAGKMDIVQSNGSFFVVQMLERNENGPLPADILTQRQNSALSDWLQQYESSTDVTIERLLQADQAPPDPFAVAQTVPVP